MKDRDKEMLVPMLRDCPPEKLKQVVERNYKARMPGGGWVSPLDTSSIDMEAMKDYLEQKRKDRSESEAIRSRNLSLFVEPYSRQILMPNNNTQLLFT